MNGYGRWGYLSLALVMAAALQTVYGQDQEQPLVDSNLPLPSALVAGNPEASMAQMREAYAVMKENNFNPLKLPLHLLQSPDHFLNESESLRDPRGTTYALPWLNREDGPDEIVMYTGLYFRQNCGWRGSTSECRPEGFFLVMFKDGKLVKVPGKDVRMVLVPNAEPGETTYCFPGMRAYDESLPRITVYREPWYVGPQLD